MTSERHPAPKTHNRAPAAVPVLWRALLNGLAPQERHQVLHARTEHEITVVAADRAGATVPPATWSPP